MYIAPNLSILLLFLFFSQEIDEPALIPHIAEASSKKYPYEVLFRSLHKLLMDTAASEYFDTALSDFFYLNFFRVNTICSLQYDHLPGAIFQISILQRVLQRTLNVL